MEAGEKGARGRTGWQKGQSGSKRGQKNQVEG